MEDFLQMARHGASFGEGICIGARVEPNQGMGETTSLKEVSVAGRYGIALLAMAGTLIIRFLCNDLFGEARPFITAFGAVAVGIWFSRWQAATVAALIGFLACEYLFVEPRYGIHLNQAFLYDALGYAISSGAIIIVGEAMHRAKDRVMREIMERRRAEEALRTAQAQLAAANEELSRRARDLDALVERRTAELRDMVHQLETFSYSVVHDMRAPLRTLASFAAILRDDYGGKLDATALEYLQRISTAAQRMDQLITDILNYTRVSNTAAENVRVNLDEFVPRILNEYPQLHVHAEAIEVRRPLPVVRGNPSLLVQVFSNLIENAFKFMPHDRKPRVVVRAEQEDDKARVFVEDNGIGIAPEHHERLFKLFSRLHTANEYTGTGVGLAIVKKAAERMGGTVKLESVPNEGSRFCIELKKWNGA